MGYGGTILIPQSPHGDLGSIREEHFERLSKNVEHAKPNIV
jgi:hypothetical protein